MGMCLKATPHGYDCDLLTSVGFKGVEESD